MENLLSEAFQRLSLLEQDFDFSSVDKDKVDELTAFISDDIEEIPEEPIIDVNAQDESDLADNYIGKVILECECCHTRIYKDENEVVIDDESGAANIDEACPVCNNEFGYSVIGKIEAFDSDRKIEPEEGKEDVPEEPEEENEEDAEVEEPEEDEEEKDESLKNSKVASEDSKKLDESEEVFVVGCDDCGYETKMTKDEYEQSGGECPQCHGHRGNFNIWEESLGKSKTIEEDASGFYDRKFDKDFDAAVDELERQAEKEKLPPDDLPDPWGKNKVAESVELHTDGEPVDLVKGDDGSLSVNVGGGEATELAFGEPLEAPVENKGEEIVPLDAEDQAAIEANEPGIEDEFAEEPVEDEFTEEPAEEENEFEGEESLHQNSGKDLLESITDLDEVAFNKICETYLTRVYGNVKSFETSKVLTGTNKVIVEGIINFESGKSKNTVFNFANPTITKRGKLVMEGLNKTFSNSDKAFTLKFKFDNTNLIAESMVYNYTYKQLNESNEQEVVRVCGRVKA